jgi:hypothetical protein
MSNYRVLFLVSLGSSLGVMLLCLTPFALAGTTADSFIKEAENKVMQDTSFPTSKITTLDLESLSADESTTTPIIKVAGNTNTIITSSDLEEVPKAKFDWTKEPHYTKSPRPGGFVVPAGPKASEYPGQYSLFDFVTGKERETKPVQPYSPFALQTTPAFDINFNYLENPDHETDLFDPVKRIHLGDDFLLSFGGQFWYRYMHETDSRLNAAGRNNSFHLARTRFHGDIWYQDKVRIFAEFLDARIWGQELAPLGIDANHTDMLSIFADIKLAEAQGGKAYVRVGRQELTLGSQRLVSSLDWVNTRRTFQGVKVFWNTPKFDISAFAVRPQMTEVKEFDNWNKKRDFWGLWGTYKPKKGDAFDLYYMGLNNHNNKARGQAFLPGDAFIHTIGSRYIGTYERFLYELEGMYQFGTHANQDISAGAVAVGGGYRIPLPFNPQFWLRYDYASGDDNLGVGGTRNTFNHLFPFGNYYMGWLDRVGRQNIHDLNAQFSFHPQRWLTFLSQYHRYYLASKTDFLYNAGGAATLRDPTGLSGSHVGDEIDIRLNIHVDRHQDVLVGYSKMWAGGFMKATRPGVNPDLFYVQYNFRF